MEISFESPFHIFRSRKKIENMERYHQFLNWLKGEFDLFLMDELNGLEVYYPSGFFSVGICTEDKNNFYVKIKVLSKTLKTGSLISSEIENVYRLLERTKN